MRSARFGIGHLRQCRLTLTHAVVRVQRRAIALSNEVTEPDPPYLVPTRSLHHEPWQTVSISNLLADLRSASSKGNVLRCHGIVKHLIAERGEHASVEYFNALILANINPTHGTAKRVRDVLQEMAEEGIEIDATTCHNILKVVAVHSDHLLRCSVLETMKSRWLHLTEDGHHDVAAGWLREGCLELALNQLEAMRREGINTQTWLLDMFAYALCDAEEVDAVYRIMRARDDGDAVSQSLWYYTIDAASLARHLPATELVWRTRVQQGKLHVGSGICLNILATAAGAGDATMATEVLDYMIRRGERPSHMHYQLLIDSYMQSKPDVKAAFTVLSTMAEEKVMPDKWQTRSLFSHLRQSSENVEEALSIVRELHDKHRLIPIAALNVIIESYTSLEMLELAIRLYKQIHTFNPMTGSQRSFANTETFNLLFKACRLQTQTQQAEFLSSEMVALEVQPDDITFDRLILLFVASVQEGSTDVSQHIELAVKYFRELVSLNWSIRAGTVTALALCLADMRDERCFDVLRYADQRLLGSSSRWPLRAPAVKARVRERLMAAQGD